MANEDNQGSRFIVDLGDVKLPALKEKQVQAEIQAVVLRALADSGHGSDPQRTQAREKSPIWDFLQQIYGMWPGWPENPPVKPRGILGSDGGPITVRDHTRMMEALMEHPVEVLRNLPDKYKRKGARPPGTEVIRAALQVEQIDPYIRGRMQAVLDVLPKIEERLAALPQSAKESLDNLREQLANRSGEEKLRLLRDAEFRSRYADKGLTEGMDIAAQILQDGQDSIYSPDNSFYKLLQSGEGSARTAARDTVSDVKDSDTIGATGGGFVGTVVPGLGTAAGAAAGGFGASAGAAVAHLIKWLF